MNKTKRKIFETSMKLFAEKGYDATSIEDITATVGVAKGTLYYHFSSKEEIFEFLIGEGVKLLKNSIEIKTEKLDKAIDKIKRNRESSGLPVVCGGNVGLAYSKKLESMLGHHIATKGPSLFDQLATHIIVIHVAPSASHEDALFVSNRVVDGVLSQRGTAVLIRITEKSLRCFHSGELECESRFFSHSLWPPYNYFSSIKPDNIYYNAKIL